MNKKIKLTTASKKLLADIFTPVGIYLRLRDRFRDTILLESTDFRADQNNYSIIGINALAGIEIVSPGEVEFKLPGEEAKKISIDKNFSLCDTLQDFMQNFEVASDQQQPENMAQGLFGYLSYDSIPLFENIIFSEKQESDRTKIPIARYRLYQYIIVINHFKDELFICQNHLKDIEGDIESIENIIRHTDVPVFPFKTKGEELSNVSDETYKKMVESAKGNCARGDVFQVVLSREFYTAFSGDEFNVYRCLRNINPSPYLFYFDYGDYRLMGSSPESQLIVKEGKSIMHPIAGTKGRSGNKITDQQSADALLLDKKENAEHVMLVDLARNDLSRSCTNVEVSRFCEVQYFSHVIHLVSEVKGEVAQDANPFQLLANTFPAGTLSGAPKHRAMQLIDGYENISRGFYGGTLGFVGFDGSVNHAIMIRTFLSKNNFLTCRAGAGITISSMPESELNEVNSKLNALKAAIVEAEKIKGYE